MRNLTCSTLKGLWSGMSLYSYVCHVVFSCLSRIRRIYGGGCLPIAQLQVLGGYAGEFKDKVRSFVSEYCSHLASGNDKGIDPHRAARLALFISRKQQS